MLEYKVLAGSQTGSYHISKGLPNQDNWSYIQTVRETVLCVADGAGSLAQSDIGSSMACLTFVKSVMDSPGENIVDDMTNALIEAREMILSQDEAPEMGCTLVGAVIRDGEVGVIAVGDSFAIVHGADGSHVLVTDDQCGEFVNITNLITSRTVNPVVQVFKDSVISVTLASDGLAKVSLDGWSSPSKPFWDNIISRALAHSLDVQELLDYLASIDQIDDDSTILMSVKS